jgi:hypothetical protein
MIDPNLLALIIPAIILILIFIWVWIRLPTNGARESEDEDTILEDTVRDYEQTLSSLRGIIWGDDD